MLDPGLPAGGLACLHLILLHSREAEAFILGLVTGFVVGLLVPQELLFFDIDSIIPAAWQVCTCADFDRWVASSSKCAAMGWLSGAAGSQDMSQAVQSWMALAIVCKGVLPHAHCHTQQLLSVCRLAAPPHLTPGTCTPSAACSGSEQVAQPKPMAWLCGACIGAAESCWLTVSQHARSRRLCRS